MKSLVKLILVLSFAYLLPIGSLQAADKKTDEKEGSYSVTGIEVIQNRLFQKAGRHELGVSFGVLYDNPFVFYEMLPIQYTYHLRESIGIELTGAFAFGQEKGLVNSLRDQYSLDVKVEKIKRYYTGNFVWSPIYGKFNIFASQIYHFDLFLTAGFGMMENSITIDNTNTRHFTFNIGAGAKIYLNDWMVLRLDFRNFTYKEGQPFLDTINSRILTLGAAVFFPFHKSGE